MKKIQYLLTAALLPAIQLSAIIPASAGGAPSCDISGTPISLISASDLTVTAGTEVQFDSRYSMGCGDTIVAHNWELASGLTSTEKTPVITPQAGIWPITLTVTDEAGLSASRTVTLEVRDVNATPVAHNDTFTFVKTTSGSIVANDTDAEGDYLEARVVTPPTHGTVSIPGYDHFSYTANEGFVGTDSFQYVVVDEFEAESAPATVYLNVQRENSSPVAQDDEVVGTEDMPMTFYPAKNDSDADGDALIVSILSISTGISARVNADQSITFSADANTYGSYYAINYRIDDGYGGYDYGKATITIQPVNDAPSASNDEATVSEDGEVQIKVTANDHDIDGDYLYPEVSVAPAHGQVKYAGSGVLTYRPNANYHGTDSFTYTVTDAGGLTASATVSITVTPAYDAVVAVRDSFTGTEDQQITGNVLENDTYEVGPLTTALKSGPSKGKVELRGDGNFIYTPNANYHGTDSFTYSVTDSQGGTSWHVVYLTIESVNDDPIAKFTSSIARRTVYFTNQSTDADNDTLEYQWSFGDGSSSTDKDPTRSYAKRGTYTVTLTVTDASGTIARYTQNVTVQ